MIYVFFVLIILFLILRKLNVFKNEYLKVLSKYLLIAISISTILEITIFNFRHYESLFFKDFKEIKDYTYNGITCTGELCSVTDVENAYIEFNVNQKINNIYIDFSGKRSLRFSYELYFTDEANKLYLDAGSRTYVNKLENSKYLTVHSSGTTSNVKLVFDKEVKDFKLNTISVNKKVPLFINDFRLIISLFFILFIFIINPKSIFYKIKFNNKKALTLTILFISILSIFSYNMTFYNKKTKTVAPTSQYSQYKNLARALANNHFYLDLDVSDKLLSLENPYDTKYRDEQLERYKEYYWDYSYYNGRYYSYFGVVPCILLYLPYYVVTKSDLPNNLAISIAICIFICSVFYLMYQILNKYFKNTSYIWYMFLSIFFIFASGLSSFVGYPTFYNLPIVFAIAFAMFGLAFYIKSTNYDKLKKRYLFLGSLFTALVAGCRPQVLLSMFFIAIIFYPYIFKKRELFSKKSIKETLILVAPYIVIALFLMYYNFARFKSPFDFGANYNLTTNDMTKRGFVFDRTFLGLYHFLIAPIHISTIFPFIEKYSVTTTYLGNTISEYMYGGFLFTNAICVLGVLSYKFKKIINKDLFKISIASLIFALIIVIADTQMAGILPRYISDFGWLLSLSTVIVILSLLSKNLLNHNLKKILIVFITISIILNMFTFFLNKDLTNIDKFYYMFMFWV